MCVVYYRSRTSFCDLQPWGGPCQELSGVAPAAGRLWRTHPGVRVACKCPALLGVLPHHRLCSVVTEQNRQAVLFLWTSHDSRLQGADTRSTDLNAKRFKGSLNCFAQETQGHLDTSVPTRSLASASVCLLLRWLPLQADSPQRGGLDFTCLVSSA